jgi:hypothetical protein
MPVKSYQSEAELEIQLIKQLNEVLDSTAPTSEL